jgi:hypothetical protein
MARGGAIAVPGGKRSGAPRAASAGLVVALVLAGAGHAQERPLDPTAFTEAVARLYREGPEILETHVDGPLALTVRLGGREEKINLANVFLACQRDRPSCAASVFHQVQAMKAALGPRAPLSREDVRITVRPSAYVDDLIVATKRVGSTPVAEPLVDDLWMIAVRDEPTTIETIGQTDLDALKLSLDQALALGRHNLEPVARHVIADAVKGETTGVRSFRGSDYTASLIALPELWEPLAEKFGGELLMAVPASDVVLFSDGRGGAASQAAMLQSVVQAQALAKRPISLAVFEWTPTGWNKIAFAEVRSP